MAQISKPHELASRITSNFSASREWTSRGPLITISSASAFCCFCFFGLLTRFDDRFPLSLKFANSRLKLAQQRTRLRILWRGAYLDMRPAFDARLLPLEIHGASPRLGLATSWRA